MDIQTPACIPPRILLCVSEPATPFNPGFVTCYCDVPAIPQPPKKVCTMTLQYVRDDPRAVWANRPEDGCDAAGFEAAMIAMLALMKAGVPLP